MARTAEKTSGKNLKVLHHLVGAYPRDFVVSVEKLQKNHEGVDIDRLLDLNAVEWTDEDETAAVAPPGPENRQILVDGTGRTLDAPGHDRPDVAARISPKEHRARQQETKERAEADEDDEENTDEDRDLRRRPNVKDEDLVSAANPGGTATKEYAKMKVTELREEAEGRSIEGAGSMNKADLISALEEDDRNNEA